MSFSIPYLEHPLIQQGGINNTTSPLKLYQKADTRSAVVAVLPEGGFITPRYFSKSKRWLYLRYNNTDAVTQAKFINTNYYNISGFILDSTSLKWSTALSFTLFIVYTFWFPAHHKNKHRRQIQVINNEREKTTLALKDEIRNYKDLYTKAQNDCRSVNSKLNETQQAHKADKQASERRLKEAESYHSTKQREFEVKLEELESKQIAIQQASQLRFEQEIEKEYQIKRKADIYEMQASFDTLSRVHQKALDDAEVFDVPIRDENFENMLKGREFEICIAKHLVQSGYKLLEWTPDKGAISGLMPESNQNPDLIVASPNGQKIAVECKYIGSSFDRDEHPIGWSQEYQAIRYQKYGDDNNIPVWMALGIDLTQDQAPSNPNKIIAIPLATLMADIKCKRFTKKVNGKIKHFSVCVCTEAFLNDYALEKNTMKISLS